MPEAYSESSSVVETKPRTREEVREEVREELRLLDMPRIPAEQKERLEREAVDASVGEVELFERSWRKTAHETVTDIERRVDALGTGALPAAAEMASMARSTPQAPAPLRTSTLDFTPAPAHLPSRTGRPLTSRLSPAEQRAIAKHLGGTLVKASVVFTTGRGRVVDVTYKKSGKEHSTTVVVDTDGEVATLEAIGSKLDAMAMPRSSGPVQSVEEALAPPAPSGAPRRRVAEAGPGGRTASGLLPTVANQDIERVEGIGEVYGKKLRRAGIEIIEDICLCEPEEVARESGVSLELVRKWQAMGRLQAVNGIGPQYSEVLVRAGITTMDQLARQTPDALATQLNDYEASLGVRVQGTTIGPQQTEDWIRQAKALTKAAPEAAAGEPGPGPEAAPAAKKKGLGKKAEEKPRRKFGLPFGKK